MGWRQGLGQGRARPLSPLSPGKECFCPVALSVAPGGLEDRTLLSSRRPGPAPNGRVTRASSLFSAVREVGQSDVDITSDPDFLSSTIPAVIVYDSIALLLRAYNLNSNILKVYNPNSNLLCSCCNIS